MDHHSRFLASSYNNTVKPEIASRLIDVNRLFYQTFALQFSATRQRLQPGVWRIFDRLPGQARILDLGCGNGELAKELLGRSYKGSYIGLDFSPELLNEASKSVRQAASLYPRSPGDGPYFLTADLSHPDWEVVLINLPEPYLSTQSSPPQFDIILAFAVFHHLPGAGLRQQVLQKVHQLLTGNGLLIHSTWQFLNNPRLRARVIPWEAIGLSSADVEAGDYLLDWRHGGSGLRYVHHFSEDELAVLALETGFQIVDSFYSDGEGGNLGLYQFWATLDT